MQPGKAHLLAAAPQHLDEVPRGEPPAEAEPQPGKGGVLVTGASPQVAVQRQGGLAAERQRPLATALAKHQQHVQVEVEVGHPGTHQLGAAGSHVDQQQDQRGVAAVLEALALTGGQQSAQAVLGDDRDGLLGDDRRAQPGHRASVDLAFFFKPGVQEAQHLVVGRCGAGERRVSRSPMKASRSARLAW
jgi:hypothetical protein